MMRVPIGEAECHDGLVPPNCGCQGNPRFDGLDPTCSILWCKPITHM
jgi:hypothetical protein